MENLSWHRKNMHPLFYFSHFGLDEKTSYKFIDTCTQCHLYFFFASQASIKPMTPE